MPEPKFEWFKDKSGKFRFRLVAPNGEIIAVSEAYSSKDACLNGIESVKKNAPIAKIVEAKQ
ncbi:YegP family protein [Candidatus Bathyarchaeota archaeon]|nr:YegP family protein [Candidatus Bathyarchaeota archaeon]